ncbi:MAG: carboxypeptidase-like regulatory domain-containing protein [Acidobacteriota bacterium]
MERERLEIDKSKAALDHRFWNRNSGTLIMAVVSLAAVIVSLGQVWASKVSKDRELEITSLQKKVELEVLDKQKEKELALVDARSKREWDLSVAKFIMDNRKALFSGTADERKIFAKIIPTMFPEELSVSLLQKLESASPSAAKQTWRDARENLQTKLIQGTQEPSDQRTLVIGRVYDRSSKAGIEGARLVLSKPGRGQEYTTFSGSNGESQLSLSTGDYECRVSHPEFGEGWSRFKVVGEKEIKLGSIPLSIMGGPLLPSN